MRPTARYRDDRLVISLEEPLTHESMRRIHTEIELALDYYHYRDIELVVDSPGGELISLEILLGDFARWQTERGLTLRTRVIGEAASAAAFVVALGTFGRRSSALGGRLLLHEPRALIGSDAGRAWRQSDFDGYSAILATARTRLVAVLASHVWQGALGATTGAIDLTTPAGAEVTVGSEEALRDRYDEIIRDESWLTPAQAIGLRLIDRVGTDTSLGEKTPAQSARSTS